MLCCRKAFSVAQDCDREDVTSPVKEDLGKSSTKLEHVTGVQCHSIVTCTGLLEVTQSGADTKCINRHTEVPRILGLGDHPVTASSSFLFIFR